MVISDFIWQENESAVLCIENCCINVKQGKPWKEFQSRILEIKTPLAECLIVFEKSITQCENIQVICMTV